ncbi:hypothetical protein ACRAQ7_01995 [Erythrobacter sp. W53]|uniref:hypothetical protein n=1 Tax=Erythrobacter sp. W53 TaxID=3425947 RepID=UPI003D767ECA
MIGGFLVALAALAGLAQQTDEKTEGQVVRLPGLIEVAERADGIVVKIAPLTLTEQESDGERYRTALVHYLAPEGSQRPSFTVNSHYLCEAGEVREIGVIKVTSDHRIMKRPTNELRHQTKEQLGPLPRIAYDYVCSLDL